jgi:hypothetical protein
MDEDQNDPDDIPVLLKLLAEGYDIVNGWRRTGETSGSQRSYRLRLPTGLLEG